MWTPIGAALDLLVPPRCLVCRERGAEPWCRPCAAAAGALRTAAGVCPRCATTPGAGHPCWEPAVPVDRTIAAYRYAGPVATVVATAKARGAHAAWTPLGERLATAIDPAPRVDAVTWIPVDRRRRRIRGIDHAQRLALPVAARLGVPAVATLSARPGRPDQARRDGAARRRIPTDAFAVTRTVTGARLLLIDDVLTTGATIGRAAQTLVAAGAAPIAVAVLARAGTHPLGPRPLR